MLRFAITGPESSGKSTLAEKLASTFNASFVPEFARSYLLERNGIYTQHDLPIIAKEQQKAWEQGAKSELLFCDTEMLVLKIWSSYKYNFVDESIEQAFKAQQFDHYFLCRPDIPWEEDPLREHPEEREQLFQLYLSELTENQLPFSIIEGDLVHRIASCTKIISSFFSINNP